MFRAALFITGKKQKQHKCPSADEWINKMWYTYNRTLFGNKKKALIYDVMQINFENIMLNERSQNTKPHIV